MCQSHIHQIIQMMCTCYVWGFPHVYEDTVHTLHRNIYTYARLNRTQPQFSYVYQVLLDWFGIGWDLQTLMLI